MSCSYQLVLEPAEDEERHSHVFQAEVGRVVQELEAQGLRISRGRRTGDERQVGLFFVEQLDARSEMVFGATTAAVLSRYVSGHARRQVRLRIGEEEFVAYSVSGIAELARIPHEED
ncbi:hypothetical protein [Lichenicoccus roseus]|uniref:Uncharacterized protein n=1 Tax=Lichenicoccus roseus TaxID=2683649 RepID=A0A5R9J3F3_9PROT|nr:hypothetical protein [Lichenicoccus roseus]TLU72144.1 hypothetical protein FE263_13570 [Lichenicoccus roseus]